MAATELRRAILRLADAGESAAIHFTDGGVTAKEEHERCISLRGLPLDKHGYVLTSEATFDPPTSPLDENGQGTPYAVFGFGAHLAEIAVDTELGTVRVLKITAAHDVGRAINPTLIEGQIEGGAAQGLGMALMEEFFPGKGENLHDYLIPSAGDMPPVESILIEDPLPHWPVRRQGDRGSRPCPDCSRDSQCDSRCHWRSHTCRRNTSTASAQRSAAGVLAGPIGGLDAARQPAGRDHLL